MITPVRIGANVLSIDSVSDDLLHMIIDPVYEEAHVAAFFSSSGREAWRTPIGPKPIADLGLYEGTIFVGGTDYYVRAVDSRAGRVRWKVPVGGAAMDKPKLSRNRVFVVTDNGYLHCLDASNGKVLWQKNLRDRIRFITADDDHVVVERSGRRLVIVDAKTGEEIATTLPMKYRFLLADAADEVQVPARRSRRGPFLQSDA
jgi:outer membrane protein assembly factor BamB